MPLGKSGLAGPQCPCRRLKSLDEEALFFPPAVPRGLDRCKIWVRPDLFCLALPCRRRILFNSPPRSTPSLKKTWPKASTVRDEPRMLRPTWGAKQGLATPKKVAATSVNSLFVRHAAPPGSVVSQALAATHASHLPAGSASPPSCRRAPD